MGRSVVVAYKGLVGAVLAVVLAAAGCGSGQNTSLDKSPGAYPPGLQGTLLGSCQGAAGGTNVPSNYCECALKMMEANLPASQVGGSAATDGQTMLTDPDIRQACK